MDTVGKLLMCLLRTRLILEIRPWHVHSSRNEMALE